MTFDRRQRVALHFSMPLDGLDWSNLQRSGARLVQIPWAHALYREPGSPPESPTQARRLAQAGYRVILRMGHEDYVGRSAEQLRAQMRLRLSEAGTQGYDAVIIFNEPDIDARTGQPINLQHGSPSWQEGKAYLHAWDTDQVRQALQGLVRLVGAPLSNRHPSEDDRPEPGLLEWWARLKWAYHQPGIVGVGCHIYEQFFNDDPGAVDTMRAKHKLWMWGSFWQPRLWMDEFSVTHGTPVERARAWCSMVRLLERCPQQLELFSPFVSNGLGNAYGADLVVRDPAAYEELGRFIRQ